MTAPACRVLIAEPDTAERQRVAATVSGVGKELGIALTIDQAGDGTTALALCTDHPPNILVAEILLEGLSGLALLRRIRAEKRWQTAVVFVTTMSHETDRYWALKSGAHAYVNKPYDEPQLRDRLHKLMAGGPSVEPEKPG